MSRSSAPEIATLDNFHPPQRPLYDPDGPHTDIYAFHIQPRQILYAVLDGVDDIFCDGHNGHAVFGNDIDLDLQRSAILQVYAHAAIHRILAQEVCKRLCRRQAQHAHAFGGGQAGKLGQHAVAYLNRTELVLIDAAIWTILLFVVSDGASVHILYNRIAKSIGNGFTCFALFFAKKLPFCLQNRGVVV